MSVNIHSIKTGDFVKFTGSHPEQLWIGADPICLSFGYVYRVQNVKVGDWFTVIELSEFPHRWFNSTCFTEL